MVVMTGGADGNRTARESAGREIQDAVLVRTEQLAAAEARAPQGQQQSAAALMRSNEWSALRQREAQEAASLH